MFIIKYSTDNVNFFFQYFYTKYVFFSESRCVMRIIV